MSNSTNSKESKPHLIAKYVFPKYGYGNEHLKGWWAISTGPNSAKVYRVNGTSRDMVEGEEIPLPNSGVGVVEVHTDRLMVGEYTIPLFEFNGPAPEDLVYSELRARPTRPGSGIYYLEKENNATLKPEDRFLMKITVGDRVDALKSEIHHTKNGQLYAGNHLIAVHPLEYEVKLNVYSDQILGGNRAYFNLCEPGSNLNMKDGIAGVFFAKDGRTPANFSEINPDDGKLYKTCTLFGNEKTKDHITGIYKTLATAIRERELYLSLKEIEKKMSIELSSLENIEGADVQSIKEIRLSNPDENEDKIMEIYFSQHPIFDSYKKDKDEHINYTKNLKRSHMGKFFIAPAPRGMEAQYCAREMVSGLKKEKTHQRGWDKSPSR